MPIYEVEGELGNSEDELMVEQLLDQSDLIHKSNAESASKSLTSDCKFGKIIIAEDQMINMQVLRS